MRIGSFLLHRSLERVFSAIKLTISALFRYIPFPPFKNPLYPSSLDPLTRADIIRFPHYQFQFSNQWKEMKYILSLHIPLINTFLAQWSQIDSGVTRLLLLIFKDDMLPTPKGKNKMTGGIPNNYFYLIFYDSIPSTGRVHLQVNLSFPIMQYWKSQQRIPCHF